MKWQGQSDRWCGDQLRHHLKGSEFAAERGSNYNSVLPTKSSVVVSALNVPRAISNSCHYAKGTVARRNREGFRNEGSFGRAPAPAIEGRGVYYPVTNRISAKRPAQSD